MLGILSLITVLFFINYVLGIIAIILAIVVFVKSGPKKGKIKAGIGLGLAVLSIAVSTYTWVSVYIYFTSTLVTQMMEDVKRLSGGQIEPEKMVNDVIIEYVMTAVYAAILE